MSVTKHTPGPWRVSNAAQVYAGNLFVAHCYNQSGQPRQKNIEEIAANAHFIAAAPELLDALQDLFDDWLTLVGIDLNEENPDCLALEKKVWAALVAARGEV